MSNIQGRVVVLAGASSGFGEAAARQLAAKGAAVYLGPRHKGRLDADINQIQLRPTAQEHGGLVDKDPRGPVGS